MSPNMNVKLKMKIACESQTLHFTVVTVTFGAISLGCHSF